MNAFSMAEGLYMLSITYGSGVAFIFPFLCESIHNQYALTNTAK